MKTCKSRMLSIGALLLAVVPVAQAAIVNVNFVAQNFTGNLGGTVPQDPVTGTFSIQHDSAADFTGSAQNPTLQSVNLAINGFSYNLTNTELNTNFRLSNGLVDFMQIGGALNGFGTVMGGTNDFNLVLTTGVIGAPSRMRYTIEGISDIYLATNTDINLTHVTFGSTVVPIPAAVWLLGSGLLGLIGVARRRRRAFV